MEKPTPVSQRPVTLLPGLTAQVAPSSLLTQTPCPLPATTKISPVGDTAIPRHRRRWFGVTSYTSIFLKNPSETFSQGVVSAASAAFASGSNQETFRSSAATHRSAVARVGERERKRM